jgi:hypothetical protein
MKVYRKTDSLQTLGSSRCSGHHRYVINGRHALSSLDSFEGFRSNPSVHSLIWNNAKYIRTRLTELRRLGTVAFDPFFQAVISTYGNLDDIALSSSTAQINSSFNATIGRALRVDGGNIIENPGGPLGASKTPSGLLQYTYTQSRPDFGIVSSINGGFYNSSADASNTVGFACATGNCTWPAFVSAAVCSSCKDVSDTLVFDGSQGTNGSTVPGATNIHIDA